MMFTTMSLSLTVLGCSGSYAGEPGDACSGYLVRTPGATTVVDLGPGTLAHLQQHVTLPEVDAVVLTHQHPDHWLELPILRNALRYYLGGEGLQVYGTAGTLEQASVVIDGLEPTIAWTTIGPSSRVRVGDQQLRFSLTDHPVETLAVRVDHHPEPGASGDPPVRMRPEAGSGSQGTDDDHTARSIVYSADTGPGWRAEELAAGADLFLCEATIPSVFENSGAPHLSGGQAGVQARVCGAKRLVLTHIAPRVDRADQQREAEATFDGPVELATTHATFVVD